MTDQTPTPANSTPRFIKNIIEKSQAPKMMEMFIYAALVRYAEDIAQVPEDVMDEKMELGKEWQICAIEVLAKIEAKFGKDESTKT